MFLAVVHTGDDEAAGHESDAALRFHTYAREWFALYCMYVLTAQCSFLLLTE